MDKIIYIRAICSPGVTDQQNKLERIITLAANNQLQEVAPFLIFLQRSNLLNENFNRVMESVQAINARYNPWIDHIPPYMINQEVVNYIFNYLALPNGYDLTRRFVDAMMNFRDVRDAARQADITARIQFPPNVQRAPVINDLPNVQRAPIINDSQSTHQASVHRTTSESASKLQEHYGANLNEKKLEGTIQEIRNWSETFGSTDKELAAKRGVAYFTAPSYVHTDSRSGVSSRQLFALIWIALHDKARRQGSLEDGEQRFQEAFFEAMREYNFDAQGVDQGGNRDRAACVGGAFNKFLEKMVGVLPDVKVEFITKGTATAKLPYMVIEEALKYLATLPRDGGFNNLIETLKKGEEGMGPIWDHIKNAVTNRFQNDFLPVFPDRRELSSVINNTGEYVRIPLKKLDVLLALPAAAEKCLLDLTNDSFSKAIDEIEKNGGSLSSVWKDLVPKITDSLWSEYRKDFANLEDFEVVLSSGANIKFDAEKINELKQLKSGQKSEISETDRMRTARLRMFDAKPPSPPSEVQGDTRDEPNPGGRR